jgi:serine/threonine-protein kinase RsbW
VISIDNFKESLELNKFLAQKLILDQDPQNIENPNGRGVFLMRKLTDDIKFDNDGRRVELYFRIANQ